MLISFVLIIFSYLVYISKQPVDVLPNHMRKDAPISVIKNVAKENEAKGKISDININSKQLTYNRRSNPLFTHDSSPYVYKSSSSTIEDDNSIYNSSSTVINHSDTS